MLCTKGVFLSLQGHDQTDELAAAPDDHSWPPHHHMPCRCEAPSISIRSGHGLLILWFRLLLHS